MAHYEIAGYLVAMGSCPATLASLKWYEACLDADPPRRLHTIAIRTTNDEITIQNHRSPGTPFTTPRPKLPRRSISRAPLPPKGLGEPNSLGLAIPSTTEISCDGNNVGASWRNQTESTRYDWLFLKAIPKLSKIAAMENMTVAQYLGDGFQIATLGLLPIHSQALTPRQAGLSETRS